MASVELRGLTKRFGSVAAVDDVSLRIEHGLLACLLGPSGCGKTTTLRLIAGFVEPSEGEIRVGERIVSSPARTLPPEQRNMSMIFQSYALWPHMTVAENVAYGLRLRKVDRKTLEKKLAAILATTHLEAFAGRYPGELSGGQQQRVALARALIIRPKVLLLDEPFSALDRNLRAAMQVELKDIQRKLGVTTIFVTHDQGEALSLSDRIAVIAEGRIRQLGAPGEIYRRPADRFVASFIGDVNVLSARLKRNDGPTATVAVGGARVLVPAGPLKAVEPGGTVDLFLRPEDLRIGREGDAIAAHGNVAAQIYQGGHVDLYVEVPQAASGRVLLRLPTQEATAFSSAGTGIAIAFAVADAVAFPKATAG